MLGVVIQILINGLISGSGIALLAVALQVVYFPTRVLFIGLAGIYALAPFLARAALLAGLGWQLAIGLTIIAGALVSVLCELLNHRRLARLRVSDSAHLIASLGSYILLVQIIAMVWGNESRRLDARIGSPTHLGGAIITDAQWITLAASSSLLLGFGSLLNYTGIGLRLRTLADNPNMLALFGYDVLRHRVFAFMMSGIFGSAAALVAAYDVGFEPQAGLHAILLAVVAVIIGGRASFFGPVVGALLLGFLRAEVVWYFSARWEEAASFGLLAIFLLVRPDGLFGRSDGLGAPS